MPPSLLDGAGGANIIRAMALPPAPGPAEQKPRPYRWVVIVVWMVAHLWTYIILESLGLLLPGIRVELGLTPIQEGWLGASAILGQLFLAVPLGWWLSRYSAKALTTLTMLASTVLIFVQGWAPGFLVLLAGRFLFGVTMVARQPARALLIRQWVPVGEVVVVNVLMNALWGVVALGIIFTPLLLNLLGGWRQTLYAFGVIALGLTLLWQVLGRERLTRDYVVEVQSRERSPITSLFRHRELWLLGIGMLGMGVNWGAFGTFWPSLMLDRYQVSLTRSASIMAISGVLSALLGVAAGLVIRRVGRKRTVIVLTGLLFPLSTVAMLWTGSYPLLLLLGLLNGIAWLFFPVAETIPFELRGITPREIAVAISFLEALSWAGAAIGPVLSGALQEFTGDLRLALVVACSMGVTVFLGGVLLPRHWERPVEEAVTPGIVGPSP